MPYFYSLCIVLALAVDRLFKLLELLPNEVLRIHRHAQEWALGSGLVSCPHACFPLSRIRLYRFIYKRNELYI